MKQFFLQFLKLKKKNLPTGVKNGSEAKFLFFYLERKINGKSQNFAAQGLMEKMNLFLVFLAIVEIVKWP